MKAYKYVCPTKVGYFKFTMTRKQHEHYFPRRPLGWFSRYEYFCSHGNIRIERYINLFAKTLSIIVFPYYVFMAGGSQWGELIREYKALFNEKEFGNFSSDETSQRFDTYKQIVEELGLQKELDELLSDRL